MLNYRSGEWEDVGVGLSLTATPHRSAMQHT
jgi:hypothetical protein